MRTDDQNGTEKDKGTDLDLNVAAANLNRDTGSTFQGGHSLYEAGRQERWIASMEMNFLQGRNFMAPRFWIPRWIIRIHLYIGDRELYNTQVRLDKRLRDTRRAYRFIELTSRGVPVKIAEILANVTIW